MSDMNQNTHYTRQERGGDVGLSSDAHLPSPTAASKHFKSLEHAEMAVSWWLSTWHIPPHSLPPPSALRGLRAWGDGSTLASRMWSRAQALPHPPSRSQPAEGSELESIQECYPNFESHEESEFYFASEF